MICTPMINVKMFIMMKPNVHTGDKSYDVHAGVKHQDDLPVTNLMLCMLVSNFIYNIPVTNLMVMMCIQASNLVIQVMRVPVTNIMMSMAMSQ